MAMNEQEMINKMYDSSLESQKQTLQQDYDTNVSNLDAQQKKAQQQTDANLNRTYVEAAKAAKNYGEVQNAYGLSSGAMSQAKLAQNNQLQADMTTIRAAQQNTDAQIERERGLLAKEFSAAIAKAKADNDLGRAQALYEAAKEEEAKLLQQQKTAANMLGAVGDFSLHSAAYGMSPDQVAALQTEYNRVLSEEAAAKKQAEQAAMAEILAQSGNYSGYAGLYGITPEQAAEMQSRYDSEESARKAEEAAQLMAKAGDYTRLAQLYGLTPAELALLMGDSGSKTPAVNPGVYADEEELRRLAAEEQRRKEEEERKRQEAERLKREQEKKNNTHQYDYVVGKKNPSMISLS